MKALTVIVVLIIGLSGTAAAVLILLKLLRGGEAIIGIVS